MVKLRFRILFLTFISVFITTACGAEGVNQQTQVAYQTAVATQRESFRVTATVEAERGLVTLDAIQDRIDRALEQRQFIISTLEARGFNMNQFATPTLAPISPSPVALTTTSNTPIAGDTPLPTSIIITPLAITPTSPPVLAVTSAPLTTNFSNSPLREVVMARGVGNDDCAVNITSAFSATTPEIYVVARAVGVQSGTNLGARWAKSDGTELVRFEFVPDFNIEDACIWFFATSDDFPFVAGGYTVTLEVNFVPASPPIPFTIAP
jgi:hypothetical protein